MVKYTIKRFIYLKKVIGYTLSDKMSGSTTKQPIKSESTERLVRIMWDYGASVRTPLREIPDVSSFRNRASNSRAVTIVAGSDDLELPSKHGAMVHKAGKSDLIVASGKGGANMGHEGDKTEAFIIREILMGEGIPSKDILMEAASTNTGQNIQYSANLLKVGGYKAESVIWVHMPFSLGRDKGAFLKQWPVDAENPMPKLYMTAPELDMFDYLIKGFKGDPTVEGSKGWHAGAIVQAAVWDVTKSLDLKNTFTVPVEVSYGRAPPQEVLEAQNELADRGIVSMRLVRT